MAPRPEVGQYVEVPKEFLNFLRLGWRGEEPGWLVWVGEVQHDQVAKVVRSMVREDNLGYQDYLFELEFSTGEFLWVELNPFDLPELPAADMRFVTKF